MKTGKEIVIIDGITFEIGYLIEREFSGYVCAMKKNGKMHGVLCVNSNRREIGFRSGIYATDSELAAIETAKILMKNKYGENRFHG